MPENHKAYKQMSQSHSQYPNNNEINGMNQMDANNDIRWKSRGEFEYAVYNLLRQWVNDVRNIPRIEVSMKKNSRSFVVVVFFTQIGEAKKAAEAQRPSESETVYKNNFV